MSCPPGLSSILAANSATQWLSEPGKEEGGKAGPEEEVESGRTGAGERVVKISLAHEDRQPKIWRKIPKNWPCPDTKVSNF